MPRLTDTAIKQAKPRAKPYKLFDKQGLFLLIKPTGVKLWRFRYRFNKKEKLIAFGKYPHTTLKQARSEQADALELIASGIDPSANRKATKATSENSFQAVALEWHQNQCGKWVETYQSKIKRRMEKDLFPFIGNRPINEITPPELLAVLRKIEDRGAIDLAHRAKTTCGQIFRYGVATGRCERDTSADLKGALKAATVKHHASITEPLEIGALLRAIDGYQGDPVTRAALRLAPLLFVRPGELRHAEWSEINLGQSEWRIPASKMKMKVMHIVPLSSQAVAILEDIQQLTGGGKYVFPGARSAIRPMSENTVNAALRRLGYTNDQMTGHGFRSMASTRLNESQKWNADAIERQLAHGERNNVRAAYNYAEHLPERVKMMQWWADYLDDLRDGAQVIPIRA
ncbi:MAG TPA: DUF4102 domain-containing protein [Gammaproteobacteria bacterium]|nr:DUF4102 domain-containing protein [Gammaproteobacteria bacterium]